MTFDPSAFLSSLRRGRGYAGQLAHARTLPARAPRYGQLSGRLSPPVMQALVAAGAERLYSHQAEAINAALAGQNVVVATSTASGKTLCFNVPVLEALARDPLARALYLYPTKALAQDQLGKWKALIKGAGDGIVNPLAATYDGDTPQGSRARIRKTARVLLTNPDMLHAGILPNHPLWAEFFRHLKYVVIDEAHTYRGVFGSQVACVLRRLRRVCAVYQGSGVRSQESGGRGQGSGVRSQESGVRSQESGGRGQGSGVRSQESGGRGEGSGVSYPPSAISHPPSAISHPPSAISHPPSAISHQPSAIRHPPSAISHPPSAISHQPSAISHQPSAISHPPSAISHPPSAISHLPSAIRFIATSATIANPAEHFELLTGLTATVVTDDGSPHGPRTFALWNPPFVDRAKTARRSANGEANDLFTALVSQGVRTIAFTRARVVAELLLRYARESLRKTSPALAERVAAYRAGYLPEERRRIERELFGGKLLGVTATTALELGIDVGGLDAALLVGYPGTIASLWQQAGRAGRGEDPALAVLIGLDNPLDQYYMRHPDDLLGRPHENALLDPDNVYILQRHLPCAAHEMPLRVTDEDSQSPGEPGSLDDELLFGPGFVDAMIALENDETLRFTGDKWIYARRDYPAQDVSLRDARGDRFAVLNAAENFRMIEELSASTAPQRVHPGAIYLHQGEAFLVTEYSEDLRHAIVTPVAADFYTQPRELNDVRVVRSTRHRELPTTTAYLGRVRVRGQVIGYRRLRQFSEEVLEDVPLEMPETEFETVALWWDLPEDLPRELVRRGLDFLGGIHAAEHAAIGILPLFAMCDRWDIGGLSTPRHPDTDAAQIFIYDGFPGGVGIAEKGFELLPELWAATLDVIRGCPCADGCPSCVQSPKCGNFNQPLDKQAAVLILRRLLGA